MQCGQTWTYPHDLCSILFNCSLSACRLPIHHGLVELDKQQWGSFGSARILNKELSTVMKVAFLHKYLTVVAVHRFDLPHNCCGEHLPSPRLKQYMKGHQT